MRKEKRIKHYEELCEKVLEKIIKEELWSTQNNKELKKIYTIFSKTRENVVSSTLFKVFNQGEKIEKRIDSDRNIEKISKILLEVGFPEVLIEKKTILKCFIRKIITKDLKTCDQYFKSGQLGIGEWVDEITLRQIQKKDECSCITLPPAKKTNNFISILPRELTEKCRMCNKVLARCQCNG